MKIEIEHKKKHKYYFELPKELKELLLKNYKIGKKLLFLWKMRLKITLMTTKNRKEKRDDKNLQKLCV